MAIYKVPQDVEAEDKLLGPFSFKQFIFLIIMVASLGVAYGLSRILLPLAIIPLPVAIFFGTLALPLRKDQPMEVYLAAVISFILKPKTRLWRPDGVEVMIEVIAPKTEDRQYGKGYSEEEVQRRLSYLANLVDSRGWSIRGANDQNNSLQDDLYNEVRTVDDLLDDSGSRAQTIDSLLSQADLRHRQELAAKMQPAPVNHQPEPIIYTHVQPQASTLYTPMTVTEPTIPNEGLRLVINPYPIMDQSILQPLSTPQDPVSSLRSASTPSPEPVSPAIIDLANNHANLSVEMLQREANRIRQKEESKEVVISLR